MMEVADIKTVAKQLELINDVTVNYRLGKLRGYTSEQTEMIALMGLRKAIEIIDDLIKSKEDIE